MIRRAVVAAALLLVVAGLPLASGAEEPVTGLRPVQPQPTPDQLQPGLAVQYAYALVRHVDELKGKKFEPGPPLPHLNHHMGFGKVLTSKTDDGVGVLITGFIRFEKDGVWGFNVTSNDGVRLEIGDKLIYEDPGVHADDTSERMDVKVERPGWYPIKVTYFERRNTATIIVRWIGPGETGKLVPIPASAFAHPKK
jgi:hypothetical protein